MIHNFFKLLFALLLLLGCSPIMAQTKIQMRKDNGVFYIPCKINGIALDFIFDTGASDVSISLTEARYMIKNGFLTKQDIIGSEKFTDATGSISEGVVINIKTVEIQGMVLNNVKATIVNSTSAPLLLGQSALAKLGKVEIDFNKNTLLVYNAPNQFKVGQKSYGGLVVGYIDYNKLLIVSDKDISVGTTFDNAKKLEKNHQNKLNSNWRLPTHFECYFIDSVVQLKNGRKKQEITGISNCTGCGKIAYVNELFIDFNSQYYWTSSIYRIEYSNEEQIWAYDIGEHSASARNKNRVSAVRFVKIVEL
jgi:clan AA aspartic protease (TIGR02281 family)